MASPSEIVDALDNMILKHAASGVLSVVIDGERYEYRSFDEALRAREYFAGLSASTEGSPCTKIRFGRA